MTKEVSYNQTPAYIYRLIQVRETGDLDGVNAKREDNLHRLFYYPAMMVPSTQSAIIEAIKPELPTNAIAIDPFMGSGTSLLSCMEYGIGIYGQDINPLSVLLVQSKTDCYDTDALTLALSSMLERVNIDNSNDIDVSFPSIDKWFPQDVQIDLSRLRRSIIKEESSFARKFFWVILAEVIRRDSNDRTSTFKLHQRSIEDIQRRNVDVIQDFKTLANRGISDIISFKTKLQSKDLIQENTYRFTHQIQWGNTQKGIESEHKFDVLVSSPPYGDNSTTVTYGQHCYLQLQWIDKKDLDSDIDYDFLKTTQEIDRQSLGGKINNKWVRENLPAILERIPSLKGFMGTVPEDEKEKYYKTISFISDFESALSNIVESMSDDAFYIWTIGNRNVGKRVVPNDKILIDLMENLNIKLVFNAERKILNKTQASRNKTSNTMEKEHILIFHR